MRAIRPNSMTTAQVGFLTGVCARTVCKWIDTGMLKGHRLPGKDRRVCADDLMEFARKHGYPVNLIASKLASHSV